MKNILIINMSNKCIVCGIPDYETLKKNGTFNKYFFMKDKYFNELECFFKKKTLFIMTNKRMEVYSKTKEDVIPLFNYLKKLTSFNLTLYSDSIYYFYYEKKDLDLFSKYLYLMDTLDYVKDNWLKRAGIQYSMIKIKLPNIKEKQIFIELFYRYYAPSLLNEIKEKFGINILNFNNYHELYIFLDKKGYVKKYYQQVIDDIKKEANNIEKSIEQKEIDKFKKKILKKSKPFHVNKNIINEIKKLNK